MENLLSQPAPPPQCGSSPRLLPAIDTGSGEPGTPRRLPAIGTGSDEPGVSRAKNRSTEKEGNVPRKDSVDNVLRVSCTSPEQECVLLQPDVEVDDEEKISTSEQAAARKEFARLPKKRQQQRMTAWTTEQSKQLVDRETITFLS